MTQHYVFSWKQLEKHGLYWAMLTSVATMIHSLKVSSALVIVLVYPITFNVADRLRQSAPMDVAVDLDDMAFDEGNKYDQW
jgi:di/tricarboxylate transporter